MHISIIICMQNKPAKLNIITSMAINPGKSTRVVCGDYS